VVARSRAGRGGLLRWAAPFVVLATCTLLLRQAFRVEVHGGSMAPVLAHGDWVAVLRCQRPGAGSVVVARDPRHPGRLLVKRLRRYTDDGAWLEGENLAASTDSRTFGPVPLSDILGRVVLRYWPRPALIR
jgi:nickel-type superoxide dismutase maturation protease